MLPRWSFLSTSGWQQFHHDQHEGIHSAWLGRRPTYSFSLGGNRYKIDLVKLKQINEESSTIRQIRPPAWAVSEIKVGKFGNSVRFEKLAALLQGDENVEPTCEVRLTAVGAAIPIAASLAARAEADGLCQMCCITTGLMEGIKKQTSRNNVAKMQVHLRSTEALARANRKKWNKLTAAMAQELEHVPKLNLLRLMKEFRGMEAALRSSIPADGGVVRCEPVEDSLLEWDVAMDFPSESDLKKGLNELAALAREESPDMGLLLLRMRFPTDFPANPPEVWIRRPRLLHKNAPVTFGGRFCNHLLSRVGWEPSTTMRAVCCDVQRSLLESGTEVDTSIPVIRSYLPTVASLERQRSVCYPTANMFSKKGVKVISPVTAFPFLGSLERLETSDKIALPLEYLEEICGSRALESPAMFEVKTKLGRKRHCAVFDWIDGIPDGHAVLPGWVMEDLCVDESEAVEIRGVRLELASYVKVQPHSADFYHAAASTGREIADLLTESLSKFSGLTEDTCVPITLGDQSFNVQVVQLRPQAAVRIIDDDVEAHFEFRLDFEPAPDLEDESEVKIRRDRLMAEYRAAKEKQELEKRLHNERRQEVRRKRYESELSNAEAVAAGEIGISGEVEVPLKFPDGTQICGLFPIGTPMDAVKAFALRSDWAKNALPFGIQLRERVPPRRIFGENVADKVTKDMHRSVLVVLLLVCEEEASDEDGTQQEVDPTPIASTLQQPLPPPLVLERNVSQLQTRTLQAFEAMCFERAGMDPEEAARRAQRGEVAQFPRRTPAQTSTDPTYQKNKPRRPNLHRSVSIEDEREKMVVNVMNFACVLRMEALRALEECDWQLDAAVNRVLEEFD